jgi:hypothetical protein
MVTLFSALSGRRQHVVHKPRRNITGLLVHFLQGLLLSALFLSGCGDKTEREFIRGCKSGGGTTAICGCIYDDLTSAIMKYLIMRAIKWLPYFLHCLAADSMLSINRWVICSG